MPLEDRCYELPLEDNDEDDENNGVVGWEYKDTTYKDTTETSRRRHHTINRVDARHNHLVEASIANPVQFKRKRSYIQRLSSFSYDQYFQDDWIKCPSCLASDSLFERVASAQSSNQQEKKRKYEEKKIKSENFIKKSKITTENSEGKSLAEIELNNFMKAIEKCTLPQLKALCFVNKLMVSGTKSQLLERLVRCRRHGGPGVCPKCDQPKLKFEYPYPSTDVMALPNKVSCAKGIMFIYGYISMCIFMYILLVY
jgi:hypothetical protein